MLVVFATPRDRDCSGLGIDAVLDKFGDRFQRVALRERDNANRVPVIANPQLSAIVLAGLHANLGLLDRVECHILRTSDVIRDPDLSGAYALRRSFARFSVSSGRFSPQAPCASKQQFVGNFIHASAARNKERHR
jgi:hypothetical protein